MDEGRITFRSKVDRTYIRNFSLVALLFFSLALFSYWANSHIVVPVIASGIALLLIITSLLPYLVRYELYHDRLVVRNVWRKVIVDYSLILYLREYSLPQSSFRVFGLPFLGAEYSNNEVGEFWAMAGEHTDGVLVELRSQALFGNQMFITPRRLQLFREELEVRSGIPFNQIVVQLSDE